MRHKKVLQELDDVTFRPLIKPLTDRNAAVGLQKSQKLEDTLLMYGQISKQKKRRLVEEYERK